MLLIWKTFYFYLFYDTLSIVTGSDFMDVNVLPTPSVKKKYEIGKDGMLLLPTQITKYSSLHKDNENEKLLFSL